LHAATKVPPTVWQISIPDTAGGPGSIVRTTTPAPRLPSNQLYSLRTAPGTSHLVETDPRFTSGRDYLSTAYLLEQLHADPEHLFKRYGDGFVEQQLINDQLLALTGRRLDTSDTSGQDSQAAY